MVQLESLAALLGLQHMQDNGRQTRRQTRDQRPGNVKEL